MRNRLPKYVYPERRGSRVYYYFRVGKGPRTPLPDDIHSAEFRAAYAAAMAGEAEKPKKGAPGTIGALIDSYEKSGRLHQAKGDIQARLYEPTDAHPQGSWRPHGLRHDAREDHCEDTGAPRRTSRSRARHAEEASYPHPARNRYRVAAARSIGRDQAAQDERDSRVDKCRARDFQEALADRHE